MNDATSMPSAVGYGDTPTAESLLSSVYEELRKLATHKLAQEAPGHTLQPTALVHEAWLRLVGSADRRFANRAHFFHAAAEAMRRILIDRARRRQARRHGGELERVDLDDWNLMAPGDDDQLLAVDDALEKLAREHPIQAQVVKLRYFGGLTHEETAQLLDLSVSTVKNHWTFARAWLFQAIRDA